MADRWPVVITDDDGDTIEVDLGETDPTEVYVKTSLVGVLLNADQRERLAQALVAASHEADRQARPAPCGAVSPYAGPPCSQYGDHGEHIAREAGGMIVASWPVSDG